MVVHGAVLSREGAPIAPVTTIGAADDYAVATVGDQIDLWLRRAAPSEAQTVSWVRARCALPMDPTTSTSTGVDE
jgi:hypothetical protein